MRLLGLLLIAEMAITDFSITASTYKKPTRDNLPVF